MRVSGQGEDLAVLPVVLEELRRGAPRKRCTARLGIHRPQVTGLGALVRNVTLHEELLLRAVVAYL
jgi:hypothetical protein